MSSATAAKFALTHPKYEPPPAVPAKPSLPPEPDKPRNGIVRLPSYVVRAAPLRDFKPRELLTPSGKLAYAYKEHPGLHIGNLFGLNNGIAQFMLEEEYRLERMKEMSELTGLITNPTPEDKAMIKDSQQAFIRSNF